MLAGAELTECEPVQAISKTTTVGPLLMGGFLFWPKAWLIRTVGRGSGNGCAFPACPCRVLLLLLLDINGEQRNSEEKNAGGSHLN